ncbi:MAG: hypothetical protein EHM47_16255 [Ignavibacteriales bacterium]|nr:MAG: hypothetical protein EHM47_16255 [Ignavibacteriales bacterium]
MKKEDVDKMLSSMDLPEPENIKHQQELKIPLLSYKRSSRAGLWLLIIPAIFAVTVILKYELGIMSSFPDAIENFFSAIDRNQFLTYLIPIIFIGLPLLAMIINLLAFCHFTLVNEKKELLITIKYRPLNIAVFLFSFAIIIFFLLPDKLSF